MRMPKPDHAPTDASYEGGHLILRGILVDKSGYIWRHIVSRGVLHGNRTIKISVAAQ
jgi:hypothetical protein